jgi:tetratricopeptide (TPR) repeat protein
VNRRLVALAVSASLLIALVVGIYWRQVLLPERSQRTEEALEQGISLFNGKRYEQSLAALESIPDSWIEDWRFPYYRGSALMMMQDYPAAAAQLEQALALDPAQTGVLYALGVSYFKMGNLSLAKGYFASVLEINPADEQAKGLMDIMAKLEREQPATEGGD